MDGFMSITDSSSRVETDHSNRWRVMFLPTRFIKELHRCAVLWKGSEVWVKGGSLWVAWVHLYILKGHSVLQVQAQPSHSWAWKKLLKLRSLVPLIGGFHDVYKAEKCWELLRHKQCKIPWHKIVWGNLTIPRHSFIAWID
ncbi:hypothetical protein J1N35_015484 [Gossypium stocksii]|uniref:Reverse transcriptase zinc-binding domain-containing protein n=1 Tax=Gossypium stocksii TaxID=47602 RepID=A0A9D3VXA1_9ROSI|nr:hypothetical protein J1N35_015484 [Gossypium stocksii]